MIERYLDKSESPFKQEIWMNDMIYFFHIQFQGLFSYLNEAPQMNRYYITVFP